MWRFETSSTQGPMQMVYVKVYTTNSIDHAKFTPSAWCEGTLVIPQ